MLKVLVRPCGVLLSLFLLALVACSNSLSDPDGGLEEGGRLSTTSETSPMFKSLDGCGYQIWSNTFSVVDTDEATCIYVGSSGWWGGAWGAYEDGVAIPGKSYDLSSVSKVSFDAKAISGSRAAADVVGTLEFTINTVNAFKASLTTEYQTFSFPVNGASGATSQLFSLGGADGLQKNGVVVFIKNIAFYSSTGKEISPELQNKSAVSDATDVTENVQPFKSLGGCGYQVWDGTIQEVKVTKEYMSVKAKNNSWWGGAWGAIDGGNYIANTYYDVSKIAKITFKAKASMEGMLYFNVFGSDKDNVGGQRYFNVKTDEWTDVSYTVSHSLEKSNALFAFGSAENVDVTANNDGKTKGDKEKGIFGTNQITYLKDIAFYDKDGNEITSLSMIVEW